MGATGGTASRARRAGASLAGVTLALGLVVPIAPEAVAQEVVRPAEVVPTQTDDPLLGLQWHLDRTRVRQAWSLTEGSPDVTIAVIDTGVDPRHRDLAGALWSNPDGGGAGFDYLRWVRTTYVSPDHDWHGTAVAGVAAARSNDGYGMAGVAPGVKVMVRRIYASTSSSKPPSIVGATDAPRAIRDAVTDGADVVLLTWGSDQPDPALFEAIRTAGVPVVAAAGNDGWDLSAAGPKRYPAAYNLPNLVTVAATDSDRQLFDDGTLASNFGVDTVDLAAPGQRIVSLIAGGEHDYFSGTSFASPQVAGALALGRSLAPGAATSELIGTLVRTTRRSAGLAGRVSSGGELDVLAFLQSLDRPVCDPTLPPAMFDDYERSSVHAENIDCIVFYRISQGIAPGSFAPSRRITRGEMASFLARTLVATGYAPPPVAPSEVTDAPPRRFTDTGGTVHADAVDLVAMAGVAQGRSDGTFGPGELVTRAQMATFVVRTVEVLTDQPFADERIWFDDATGHFHERNINVARDLGITLGGTDPRRFEPERTMTRAQMASFVARTLDALGRRGVEVGPVPS